MKKSTPAVWRLAVMLSIGPRNVSAAVEGPRSLTMSFSASVVPSGSPNNPTTDTRAMIAGKRASTP